MKKIYLMMMMAFLGGHLLAQSTTQPNENQNATVTQDKVSVNSSATLSGYSKSQDNILNTATTVEELPGYPVLQNTGNADKDKENFDGAKEKWMKDNKALYDEFMKRNQEKKKDQKENQTK
jgi:hypothetical protein